MCSFKLQLSNVKDKKKRRKNVEVGSSNHDAVKTRDSLPWFGWIEVKAKEVKVEDKLKMDKVLLFSSWKSSRDFIKQEEDSAVTGLLDGTTKSKVEPLMAKTTVAVKCVLSAAKKWDKAYKKTPGNMWKPPRSPYNLPKEGHAFDPWRFLV
ncbi:Uncharacterized protein Adt_35049 [Abeliophyllum distichum]|uniref:Uncharacterized protein n=1 Tax=Abeliophyllum distichum TaxID=126358 RepID=A0ABD1QDS3_9LAMI